jgi:hypothetical protein
MDASKSEQARDPLPPEFVKGIKSEKRKELIYQIPILNIKINLKIIHF